MICPPLERARKELQDAGENVQFGRTVAENSSVEVLVFQVRAAGKVRDTAVSRGNFKPSRRYKREIRDNGAGNRHKGTYQRVEDEKGSS